MRYKVSFFCCINVRSSLSPSFAICLAGDSQSLPSQQLAIAERGYLLYNLQSVSTEI